MTIAPQVRSGQLHGRFAAKAVTPVPVTITQVITIPTTFTNFDNVPLTPALALFDPRLGTLTKVTVTSQADLMSDIKSENTSVNSPATITGFTQGTFTLSGLNQPLVAQPMSSTDPFHATVFDGTLDFMPTSGITFPTLKATATASGVFTSKNDLDFYTAKHPGDQLTPTMSAMATAGASAPDGNLTSQVTTTGSATVTVTYTYTPVCSQPPAKVLKVTELGVHHQPTRIVLTFDSVLDPVAAQNVSNYTLVGPGPDGKFNTPDDESIAINSAVYNPATHTVTLTPAIHLNVHLLFQLTVKISTIDVCDNGSDFVTIVGGKGTLGPIVGHHGQTFQVLSTGRLRRRS